MKQGIVCRVWKSYTGKGRKQLCKKALAVSVSIAAAVSLLPVNMATAAAAEKPYVSMRTKFKTLQVGQKNRMTLKNNTAGWKIQKISTKDESIASVSEKTGKSFEIQGNAVGRTTVKAVLKTSSRKKHNTKTVKCRVNVIEAEKALNPDPEPEPQAPAAETEVSSQTQLEEALLSSNLKKITITSQDAERFVIPAGTYTNVDLIVDAPAADIENSGVFQSIEIRAVKPDTWIEKAVGNVMRVTAKAARVIVSPGAHMKEITFPQAEADVKLEVNGKADNIRIQSKMKLSVSGKPETDLSVSVEQTAADTQIVSETPLGLSLHAAAVLTFVKGAEGSAVSLAAAGIKAVISNLTSKVIQVKRENSSSINVSAGQKDKQVSSESTSYTGSGSSGSGISYGTGSGTSSGTGSSTGSGTGSDSSTGSGSNTGAEENGIPVPSIEEVMKGLDAYTKIIVGPADGDNAKVYWSSSVGLREAVYLEDRPELSLQYTLRSDPIDESQWTKEYDIYGGMDFDLNPGEYYLTGSTRKSIYVDVSFRYADKEKNEVGEPVKFSVRMWNEEIVRQYAQAQMEKRTEEWKGMPFSMRIPIKTLQGTKIEMVYDENQNVMFENLAELPQWTGDGPEVPQVQAADVATAITQSTGASAKVVVSGPSIEAVENGEGVGFLDCELKIPLPLAIPENLVIPENLNQPGAKIQWRTRSLEWRDLSEDGTFSYNLQKPLADQKDLDTDNPYTVEVWFRYMSAGGSLAVEYSEGIDDFKESGIVLEIFNSDLKQACVDAMNKKQSGNAENGQEDTENTRALYKIKIDKLGWKQPQEQQPVLIQPALPEDSNVTAEVWDGSIGSLQGDW